MTVRTPDEFEATLTAAEPPEGLSPALRALWYVARDEWERAHAIVQGHEGEAAADWVHAHLHRVEGDLGNAGYWYRRAGRPMATGALDAERRAIVRSLLEKDG